MSKRPRGEEEAAGLRRAIELICHREPTGDEVTSGGKLTQLEQQVVHMRESLPTDVILLVACGYRIKFYGRDSRVASRRFGIMCIQAQPFEYSSVPCTRVSIYISRLVAMGYRVAFADQESASLRATSGNVKGIFSRDIGRLYSRGTLLPGELPSSFESSRGEGSTQPGDEEALEGDANVPEVLPLTVREESSELFLCFIRPLSGGEPGGKIELILLSFVTHTLERHNFSLESEMLDILHRYDIVEVVVLYDEKEMRKYGLQRSPALRRHAVAPSPLCGLPEAFSHPLSTLLPLHFGPTANGEEDDKSVTVSVSLYSGSVDQSISDYLVPFKLDATFWKMCTEAKTPQVPKTTEKDTAGFLDLPGTTLSALDVFHSSIGAKGSLLALLDHSITVAGLRKLRAWLAAPLCSASAIKSRSEAVTSLLQTNINVSVVNLLREFAKFGDVQTTLGKLKAQKCTVLEYLRLLRAVSTTHKLATNALSCCQGRTCYLLNDTLESVASDNIRVFLQAHSYELTMAAVSATEYYESLASDLPPSLQQHAADRDETLRMLDEELVRVRGVLHLPALEFRTISGTSFILDVPQAKRRAAPSDWIVLSETKSNVRYHTPTIVDLVVRLCSARERLALAANEAWLERQTELINCMTTMKLFETVIDSVATLDALRCLAQASSAPGYVLPTVTDETQCIIIEDGQHPMLNSLLRGGYVGCDVKLMRGGTWILTGPNMGGKSALMRMVGTFVILAQLGCYVPAKMAQLPVFKAVHCRMGSSDSLIEGSSTFLKEMEETSRILNSRSLSSSLVLLDELGRGTSSFDGIAVAAATLEYLVRKGSTTFFVTHYSQLCEPYAECGADGLVSCRYMGFREESGTGEEGEPQIFFTYKPTLGVTPQALECEWHAELACLQL
uniref:Uncharacterized protein TCIL3000_9_1740 n=1 Tax=Trypanosoma congolense (strain IL3000) TaxID=1068625 RepID=G0UTR3_TRYCI|nr:unnamed protein product [Trypanosoma congolense IL3000]